MSCGKCGPDSPDNSKRDFLGRAASALAGLTIAPGIFLHETARAKAAGDAVSSKVRWGMLVDTNKCTSDCNACVSACNEEHGLKSNDRPMSDAQWIRKVTIRDNMSGVETTLPMMCQHCENPPCVDVCPTGASLRREDGIVLVDKHRCIGCRYCMMACPYKARSFIHEAVTGQKPHTPRGKGTVESCTFCVHRVDNDRIPACVEACQKEGHGAMIFGDLNDPQSTISKRLAQFGGEQLRADLGLNPGVRYQGLT